MGLKHERLGPRLVAAARSGDRYGDIHVFLGGTGAVGGTAVLHMLSMYEEMFSIHPPEPDQVPVLVATGATPDELRAFTRRLFRFVESRHQPRPDRVRSGYLTASGVFVALERFTVATVEGIDLVGAAEPDARRSAVERMLSDLGGALATAQTTLDRAVGDARPFSRFLREYRDRHLTPEARFRSVVVGIPIPTLIAYHQGELASIAEHAPDIDVDRLKERFVLAIRDDLVEVHRDLADEVLVAHTTGVGGMYDEDTGGETSIRLGFAHAGLDRALAEKARFAQELTDLYAGAGIKVLVTAAAIGIDEVRVRERVPLHRAIRQKLPPGGGQFIRVGRPLTVPFDDPPGGPAEFERGQEIAPAYVIRSGENGFFSVADAEALYRVMKVASASELGLMLATVGLLGEDRLRPWFPGNVCSYTETDNARQVLEFLRQPALLSSQLSGLDPMSLQDLGSAKHQGELHALGLLILLHRLRTLDVDAIDPYVDAEAFDARRFFVDHSRVLTFEDLASWEQGEVTGGIQALAGAEEPEDLLALTPPTAHDLFPRREEALRLILQAALRAAWTPASLGSPVLFEREGRSILRVGPYVAPLDLLVTDSDAVAVSLRKAHAGSGNPCSFEDYRDYHVAVGGFVDVRPHAIVCTAKSDAEDLTGRIHRFTDEGSLREHLRGLEPYSFLSTAGLLALLLRLRSLADLLHEALLELGTLHEFRWSMPRDEAGHVILVPGVVEAFRMVSEGLEKTTGTERLDGLWGYERRPVPDRRGTIPGVRPSGA